MIHNKDNSNNNYSYNNNNNYNNNDNNNNNNINGIICYCLLVVRVSLVMQNMSVMCSSICVCVVLALEPTVIAFQYGQVGRILMEVAMIVLAISAQLSNVAYTIAIEKDWIVVIAEEKSSNL